MSDTEKSFIDMCLGGFALVEEVDDFVDTWHEQQEDVSLREFLGMSESEYSLWVNDPDVLPYVIYSRKIERPFAQVVNDNYYDSARLAARSDQGHKIRTLRLWLNKKRLSLLTTPEVNFAVRLIKLKELSPPVDVLSLIKEYATVDRVTFPVNVDGVCLDLKQRGKRPRVLVNRALHKHRERFTLAHELGHIIIPWHVGSIVDETEESRIDLAFNYWGQEGEANRFASELLMPSKWVKKILARISDPFGAADFVAGKAEVSFAAALIKVQQLLPKGHVYARYVGNELIFSGRSLGTAASMPYGGITSPDRLFPNAANKWNVSRGEDTYFIWQFDDEVPLVEVSREWREIFGEITTNIGVPDDEVPKFKQRVMAVISAANSSTRTLRTPEAVNSACIQRLHASSGKIEYVDKFVKHPQLNELLAAKIAEFFAEKKSK